MTDNELLANIHFNAQQITTAYQSLLFLFKRNDRHRRHIQKLEDDMDRLKRLVLFLLSKNDDVMGEDPPSPIG